MNSNKSSLSVKMEMLRFILLALGLVHISEGVISPVSHQNPQCPLWYHYYNTTTNNCSCLPIWLLVCDDGDDVSLKVAGK